MSIIKYFIIATFAHLTKPYTMEISIIATIIVIGIVVQYLSKLKEDKKVKQEEEKEPMEQEKINKPEIANMEPDTLGLMFRTLSNLGCQPTTDNDGTLRVAYQGEKFHMEFFGRYIRIWNPRWAGIEADDPNMPNVREAVNAANYNFGTKVVLDNPNEKGVIAFHTISDIMLHPACPDNDYYVKAVLDTFFDVKEQVISNFKQINTRQMEAKRPRRPVGFTTNTDSNE